MKATISTSVFLFTLSVAAVAAETPLPGLRVEPATGASILFVSNAPSQPPLTAFLVELVHYPGSYYQLWEDDITSQSIGAGVEKQIPISNMTVGAVPNYVKVTAALYADGTASGLPEKITQLIERRRYMLQTIRELINRLEKAHATDADLKSWAESLPSLTRSTQNSQAAINQSAAKTLITDIVSQLATHSVPETISWLHTAEAALVAAKPPL